MSLAHKDSVTSFTQHQSNESITAKTAFGPVMAEQINHDVVNNTESTSAQPLVDVLATYTTFASADAGTLEQATPATKTSALQDSQLANNLATEANSLTSNAASGPFTTERVADPSAGDAISEVVQAPADATDPSLLTTNASHAQLVNGTHSTTPAIDGGVEDAQSVDVSVNSDTEESRGDALELKKDDKHHARTNSVKKPTAFQKVSVSKQYLAKSATAVPVAAKPGDKPTPTGTPLQNSTKSRLVAKTGASLRDAQKTRLGSEGAGAPDASTVWNKNRPVAPAPQKTLTDEELKQQYGIHLATRLQTDENGRESKWADIDDDEDEWVPETVVWMDGTKSTLTPQDLPVLLKEQKPESSSPAKPADGPKPVLALKRPTETGPPKTILKPGAIAAAVQARQSGSPLGTPGDKASLKAKSPAPAPAKSPWAQLPPVDKISPINPPVQQQAPPVPFATQDARAYEQALPSAPAREIAADTFDRSWKEGEGNPRELFNSANGRYEPVTEGRRSSVKPDSSSRKPAVLQRPSQSGAPAEPSAAFQTRSTTQADGPWARRRGSSVSQGSIPPARRVSMSKGQEMSPVSDRRSSTVVGHDMRSSPTAARAEPTKPMFSQESAWQQQMPARPTEPPVEQEDPVKVQERVMKEKRELAKKRRQEEEEQAEKEKKERLQARLASLAGAGKSRKEREAEAAAAAATKTVQTPSAEKALDNVLAAPAVEETQTMPTKPEETAVVAASALEAQSLSSAPEPAQVRPPSPDELMPSPLPQKPQTYQPQASLPDRSHPTADQAQRQQPRQQLSPRVNARAPFQQQSAAYRTAPASSYSSPGDRKPQPFGRSPLQSTDAFSPWPTTAPNGNVWGTSGIGNGTFESANVFAPIPMSQQNSILPPPPGMPRSTSARISPPSLVQESRSPNLQQQQAVETHRGFAPPGFEARPDAFANQTRNVASPVAAPGFGRPPHAPGPIAPPSRSQPQPTHQSGVNAWRAASSALPNQYRVDAEAAERKRSEASAIVPREETIKETFKMTAGSGGRLGAPRKFEKTEYTVHDSQGSRQVQTLSPAPPSAQTQPLGPFSTASPVQHEHWKPAAENTVRIPDGSLNPAHGGMVAPQPPIAPPPAQQGLGPVNTQVHYPAAPLASRNSTQDQSPPPPEEASHPVNSGDVSHPLVRLPPGRPVVKLPPAPTQAQQQYMPQQPPNMMPQRPISNLGVPLSARPIAGNEVWQARFNGLFNRTPIQTETPPSPPKTPPKMQTPALAVTSLSRAAMDDAPIVSGATVSLPQTKSVYVWPGFTVDDSKDVVSKPMIEETFMEELSFGSKPMISIRRGVRYPHRVYQAIQQAMSQPNPRALHLDDRQSKDTFHMLDVHPRRHDSIFVSLPGTKLIRRLVRSQQSQSQSARRTSAMHQDRKPSSNMKFVKGKGKEAMLTPLPSSGIPNAGFKRTGVQATPSTATAAAPPPTATNGPSNAGFRKTSVQATASGATASPTATSGPSNAGFRKTSVQTTAPAAAASPTTPNGPAPEGRKRDPTRKPPRKLNVARAISGTTAA